MCFQILFFFFFHFGTCLPLSIGDTVSLSRVMREFSVLFVIFRTRISCGDWIIGCCAGGVSQISSLGSIYYPCLRVTALSILRTDVIDLRGFSFLWGGQTRRSRHQFLVVKLVGADVQVLSAPFILGGSPGMISTKVVSLGGLSYGNQEPFLSKSGKSQILLSNEENQQYDLFSATKCDEISTGQGRSDIRIVHVPHQTIIAMIKRVERSSDEILCIYLKEWIDIKASTEYSMHNYSCGTFWRYDTLW